MLLSLCIEIFLPELSSSKKILLTRKMRALAKLWYNHNLILVVYIFMAVVTALQQYLLGEKSDTSTHYNNFIIFKSSFWHLWRNLDLYALHPNEHFDYFKYSPTFALFMGVFAIMPDSLGLVLWNSLNAVVLFFGIKSLPFNKKVNAAIMWFVMIELVTSLQNSQSNALLGGLLILGFSFLERRNILLATLLFALTVYIKIFGIVAFSLFLLYPDKKRFAGYSTLWMLLLALIPLIIVTPSQLISQYQNWWRLLSMDYEGSIGFSVMGWLKTWFDLNPPGYAVTIMGACLFCLPLLFRKYFEDQMFRLLFLSSILLWVVIFNHKAESSTFIIAICGAAIWFFSQRNQVVNLSLIILAFILTSLSPTDLFPRDLKTSFILPYMLKVFPCILIWLKIIFDLTMNFHAGRKSEMHL